MPDGHRNMVSSGLNNFYGKAYYYHICIISRSGDYKAVEDHVKCISSHFPVIAIGYGLSPFVHAHIIIRSKRQIDYRKYHVPGLYVKFILIRSRLHFNNVVKYISNHPETLIYNNEKVMDGGSMSGGELAEIKELLLGIQRRLDSLENRIDVLDAEMQDVKKQIHEETATVERKTLADKVKETETTERRTEKSTEPERIEVRTRVATFVFQRSRKGVALRIRFASFVKPNNKNEYYLALTPDEIKALARQIINAVKSFTTSDPRNSGKKSGNVKIETGFKKALEE